MTVQTKSMPKPVSLSTKSPSLGHVLAAHLLSYLGVLLLGVALFASFPQGLVIFALPIFIGVELVVMYRWIPDKVLWFCVSVLMAVVFTIVLIMIWASISIDYFLNPSTYFTTMCKASHGNWIAGQLLSINNNILYTGLFGGAGTGLIFAFVQSIMLRAGKWKWFAVSYFFWFVGCTSLSYLLASILTVMICMKLM